VSLCAEEINAFARRAGLQILPSRHHFQRAWMLAAYATDLDRADDGRWLTTNLHTCARDSDAMPLLGSGRSATVGDHIGFDHPVRLR
jgi:hypothetical protein